MLNKQPGSTHLIYCRLDKVNTQSPDLLEQLPLNTLRCPYNPHPEGSTCTSTMQSLTDSNTATDTAYSLSTLRAQAGKSLRDVILKMQHRTKNNKSTCELRS